MSYCDRHKIKALFGLFAVCFLVHLVAVLRLATDIPLWDEWGIVEQLQRGMTWSYIFSAFNEHRIVLSKLIFWAQYHLDGLNLRHAIELNLCLYFGCVALLLSRYMNHWIARCLFILIASSSLAIENLTWAVQSQFHLYILCFLGAHQCSLVQEKSRIFWLAPVLAVLAIASFSAGVAAAACLAGLWYLKAITTPERRREFLISAILTSAAIAIWAAGYQSIQWVPERYTVRDIEYYVFLFNLIGNSFGIRSYDVIPGILILAIFAVRISLFAHKRGWTLKTICSFMDENLPFVVGLLGLVLIAKGRVNFGLGASKISRYAEIGLLLVPTTIDCVFIAIEGFLHRVRSPAFVKHVIISLLIVAFFAPVAPLSIAGNLFGGESMHAMYRNRFFIFERGELCIRDAYKDQRLVVHCEEISPSDLRPIMDWAKERKLSFAERLSR